MPDQANSLRIIANRPAPRRVTNPASMRAHAIGSDSPKIRLRTIAVTSGKGGVGKTNIATNLAISLSLLGRRAVILDADVGLANIDVMLGLVPKYHIGHLLSGSKSLSEIMIEGPKGIRIIPAGSGIQQLAELTNKQCENIFESLQPLNDDADYLLVDTGAGISDNVLRFLAAAGEVIIVCEPEPTAIVDAYAVIKVLHAHDGAKPIRVLVNSVESSEEAQSVFDQLQRVATRFIGRRVDLLGFIYKDHSVPAAVCNQEAVVLKFPNAPASRCFKALAQTLIAGNAQGQRPLGSAGRMRN